LTSNLVKWQKLRSQGLVKSSNQFVKAKQEGREISISESTKKKISKSRKGKKLTSEQKEKIKIAMRKAVLNNPDSYSSSNVSGRTPIYIYKGYKLKGSWEVEVAKFLDYLDIKWTNVLSGIPYDWENSSHIYFPDFFLVEMGVYIEVKGYERERDRAKWKTIDNLLILKKNEIDIIKKYNSINNTDSCNDELKVIEENFRNNISSKKSLNISVNNYR